MSASEIILAIATAITTAATAWVAVHRANQLTIFRIERLEAKVCERVCTKYTQQFTHVNEYERSSYSNSHQHNGLDRRIVALEAEVKFLREGGGKK
jgi:hypothetical protein